MADSQKDTIYVDIDDEITAIIDKLQNSSAKVVALVLPKRATTLQSIVNMKLLKRAGEQVNKNLVLITSEASLLPLAGAVGMHVAKTPTSRPEIPAGPAAANYDEDAVGEVDLDDEVAPPVSIADSGNKSVGELAAAGTMPLPGKPTSDTGVETLQLDNTNDFEPAAAAVAKPKKTPKPKKDKKLAVPDFNKFRLLLALGAALLIILIVGGYFALAVLPKATINVKTNASNVNTDVDFTLSTTATSFNESAKTVPAKKAQVQKTLTGTASATGQKNNGDKARGSINMTVCASNAGAVSRIPAGTGVSSGGKTYITNENAEFQFAGGSGCSNGFRFRTGDVDITAQTGGASFNVSNADFKITGRADISATGSATGGTDDIQTVVSQSDIENAKTKINATAPTGVQDELKQQLEEQDQYAITGTFASGDPATTTSSNVGDEAGSVTVTQTVTYTMLGANIANIRTLVDNNIKEQIDATEQGILSQGIEQTSFKQETATATSATMNIQTTAVVGPTLDTTAIAEQASGKKANEIKTDVSGNTGVTDVEVKMSPFWVSKAPKASKITVTIAKPTNDAN